MANGCITPQQFSQFLVTQLPVYDELIIRDVRPEDGWIGHVSVGQWDPFSGVSHTFDRFRNVQPNVAKAWETVQSNSCLGSPCDPTENQICWGSDRVTYNQERQSWISQLLCFDQILPVTRAQEHLAQIVSDILRPSTSRVMSFYLRKRAASNAKKKLLANATMTPFTYSWQTVGNEEINILTSGDPTSKLTPQMLQRQVAPLRNVGYFGQLNSLGMDYPAMIELVTDDETCWELDKAASDSRVSDAWRFNQWVGANEYYKYGFSGQIGNYVCRVDPFPLRFNQVAAGKYNLVLPYKNVAATTGIGSDDNPDFHNAQYQFSIIWHRMALQILVARMEAVNPLMPFAVRGLGGQWMFAIDNLGADCDGRPIENKRRNKGMFVADFVLATKPQYVEWSTLFFHKREPAFVTAVNTCATDPGYPTQYYNSSCNTCETNILFYPVANGSGHYVLTAGTITCNDLPLANNAVDSASLAALVTALGADPAASLLGTWTVGAGGSIQLANATCTQIVLPWVP